MDYITSHRWFNCQQFNPNKIVFRIRCLDSELIFEKTFDFNSKCAKDLHQKILIMRHNRTVAKSRSNTSSKKFMTDVSWGQEMLNLKEYQITYSLLELGSKSFSYLICVPCFVWS